MSTMTLLKLNKLSLVHTWPLRRKQLEILNSHIKRYPAQSSFSSIPSFKKSVDNVVVLPAAENNIPTSLARLSNFHLLRNILLGVSFSIPWVQRLSLGVLRIIANSKSTFLNPDVNPLLRAVIKPILYKQFCAGINRQEILATRDENRRLGHAGVVLCYGKEIQISRNSKDLSSKVTASSLAQIEQFKQGNLETLRMIGPGDWLGIKFTGAGSAVTKAALENGEAPAEFVAAMDVICKQAAAQDARIWIDAEQQAVQKAIDRWTIDLMRKNNRNGRAQVYTTIQAYLKESKKKLAYQLALADMEGFTLGIKLVRGAYIDNDFRELIHDTKEDTDKSYNSIVESLLSGTDLGFATDAFPKINLLIAGHNPHSVSQAWELVQKLGQTKRLKVIPDFAMLQGMGDLTACEMLQKAEIHRSIQGGIPFRLYRCLTWGSVQECMQYLFRRVVENAGSTDRMRDGLQAYNKEFLRRTRKQLLLA